MKYEFIDEYRSEFTVVRMCKAFRIKKSGYYRWRNKEKTDRQKENEALTKVIREVHQECKRTYGTKRIQEALLVRKITCCLGRIRRLMRENSLYCISRKKSTPYPKETIEKRFNKDVLDRAFNVNEPDEVWSVDITYVKTVEGWVYLAAVIDLFNR